LVVGGVDVIFYELFGVVGIIVFWNFLMLIVGWGFVFVFVVGNMVVFKFVEFMLLMVIWIGELVCEVGVFEYVLMIVLGKGLVVGE